MRETLIDKIKYRVALITWRLFLWATGMTAEEYWHEVYMQESHKERFERVRKVEGRSPNRGKKLST